VIPGDAEGLAEALRAAGIESLAIGDGGTSPGPAPPAAPLDPEAPAVLQPTSGTSGEPRLAVVSHRAALASLDMASRLLGVGSDDVFVCWVPPWHDLGLMRFVLGPVAFGVPCHFVPPAIRALPLWLETLERVGGTLTGAPDFAYRLAVRLAGRRRFNLSALRIATNGGEPVRRSTIEDFERRFGVAGVVRPGYGLAEATLGVASTRPGAPLRIDAHGNVSCGPPLEGVEVRVADPAEGAGELLVRSPALFSGYFDAPEATRAVLRDGWLHTGDVGRLDADGQVTVLGRRRALLKRGGVPLAPRELEEAAERVAGVRAAAAVTGPAGDGGASETIFVCVERDPAAETPPGPLGAAVAAAVEQAVGFAPGRVVVLLPRSIPRTANGKIRYTALVAALAVNGLEAAGAVWLNPRAPERPAGG
jgi:acyl-CoA synthetase (AMP-forming)/AMP-acid ligase II